ncbi:two-component system OmpR family sensor kinase [Streptomyces sp. Amel2xB2]|uniref:sensor histidine kinase n=1 Tax=Streptomyces sp. Amel2xB2 TaxID=1305829 RepID=UPI000DC046B3|nr:HAMP domain-containing sensor histidine kinase [Streptomyces sp. Amel2xB2]RAJ60472.1 two-component system OmpR family sensor kinase [Streptomyces sp. Amel2xB2]
MRSWRGGRTRRSRPLRTQLVVAAVALLAVVCAVIGTITAIAVNTSLESRLDDELRASVQRSFGPPRGPQADADDLRFVAIPGQPIGTVGARTDDDGDLQRAARSTDPGGGPGMDLDDRLTTLTSAQSKALDDVPLDGRPHTVSLPDLGDYRVQSGTAPGEQQGLVLGLPMSGVQSTLRTLVVVEVCVSAAGLVAAGLAGTAMVRIALRPLRRVAATAVQVTRLPLHSGDVELPHRVAERDTDPRTEVGQVGAALNSMLGHVSAALEARQESETRVRRFVADASHELRTPLASIRGYAELTRRVSGDTGRTDGPYGPSGQPVRPGQPEPYEQAAQPQLTGQAGQSGPYRQQRRGVERQSGAAPPDPQAPDVRYALERIEAEATRMSDLVEDLLLLARLDSGRPLDASDVGLSSLVVDAVSDARAAGPDHIWQLEQPAEPLDVRGDAPRLHQVLVNLLANARTHTPPGTTVTTRVRPSPSGDEVVVEVVDDGPGIPADVLPHIFERFARGDSTRSRAHGSTGLGLAIVEAVVAAHHGRVTVESVPGRTVFAVRLPTADPARSAPETPYASGERASRRPPYSGEFGEARQARGPHGQDADRSSRQAPAPRTSHEPRQSHDPHGPREDSQPTHSLSKPS